jgi:glutamate racemase
LGGLTVLRRVRAALPAADFVYLADQAHVPYGDRSEDDLTRLLRANLAILEAEHVDAIVMGCNTSCAVAARRGWPPARVPVLDLIEAAAQAVARAGARRVGVLATAATARSGAYGDAIRRLAPETSVQEVAAPKLVPLVERGLCDGTEIAAAVAEARAAFTLPLDALVLACTHYPLLDAAIGAAFGDVPRIDPALAQAERAIAWAAAYGAIDTGRGGRVRYVTTGALAPFRTALDAIVGELGARDVVAALAPALDAR